MQSSKNLLQSLSKTALMTQEETLEVMRKKGNLSIGIPRETSFQENRIALVPEAVSLLVNNGHHVTVETNAGKMSNFQELYFFLFKLKNFIYEYTFRIIFQKYL